MPLYSNRAHLIQGIRWGHKNCGLSIILLLKIDKRFFDRIQLILGVGNEPCLPRFQ
jgi:hypothetical protein